MGIFAGWKCRLAMVAFCAAASVASVSAHAEDQLAKVRKAGELVVGTEMQFAPFDFLENGQQADGSVVVPEVLRTWVGKDRIARNK